MSVQVRVDKKGGSTLGWSRHGGLDRSWLVSTYNLDEDTHFSYHAATLEDSKQVRWAKAKYLAGWSDMKPDDDDDEGEMPPAHCHSN